MILWLTLLLIALLLFSAFFSSVETAFTSLGPAQISLLAAKHGARGRLVSKLCERSEVLLTTLLIGNNLANLGASALTTSMTIRLVGNAYIALTTGLLTLMVLVFCEVSPKQIALAANVKICLRTAALVLFLSWIFRPFIWFVGTISRGITFLFVGKQKSGITLENLIHHVKAAEDEGLVESYAEGMVRNVFRINDTLVEAIMTHRTELFTLDENISVQDALSAFLDSGHSYAPVLRPNTEHVSGIISLLNLASALNDSVNGSIGSLVSPPILVPGTLKVSDLFLRLKKERMPLAVVLDEYGGIDGLVTLEDVMEEIFDALYDEQELNPTVAIVKGADGSWIIQGDTDFYDLNDIIGLELEHDSRTHTVGGYLLEKLERIPAPGTEVSLPEGRYIILSIVKKRISTVMFFPSMPQEVS